MMSQNLPVTSMTSHTVVGVTISPTASLVDRTFGYAPVAGGESALLKFTGAMRAA
jgi:hypothetical protein